MRIPPILHSPFSGESAVLPTNAPFCHSLLRAKNSQSPKSFAATTTTTTTATAAATAATTTTTTITTVPPSNMARRAAKRKADALDESATANNKAIPAAAAEKLPDNDAKEPVATGPVAKEPVAKETVAKKPAAKKPVAKKPVAKKAPAVRARGAPKADATTTTTTAAAAAAAAAPLPLPPSTEAGSPKKAAAAPKARRAAPLPRITPQPSSRSSSRLHDKSASPLTSGKTEHPSKRLRASLKDDSAAEPNSSPKTKAKASPKTKTASKPTAPKPKAAPRAKPAPKPPKVFTTTPTERLDVFAFGTGEYGELGLGPQPNAKIVKRPRLNALLPLDAVGIVAIAYGGMHGVALSHDGKVYTWGVNDLGALGRITEAKDEKLKDADADSSDSEDEDDVPLNEDESTPKLVEFPEGTVITRIAAGDSATIAVTNTGLVYGWGTFRVSSRCSSSLSLSNRPFDRCSPTKVFWAFPRPLGSSRPRP